MTFVRDAGVYEGARDAHVNRYQLFVERALALATPGGRIGLVAPWGLAADRSAAPLRRRLLERCDTDTIVGFENTAAVFPIHRSQRFVLVTATTGRPTTEIRCRLGERSLVTLDAPERGAGISLSPAFLRRVSGDGLELPWLRSETDLALLDVLDRRWPALGSPDGWHLRFGRELNTTLSSSQGWIPLEADEEIHEPRRAGDVGRTAMISRTHRRTVGSVGRAGPATAAVRVGET